MCNSSKTNFCYLSYDVICILRGFNWGFSISLVLRNYYFVLLSYNIVPISTKNIVSFLNVRGDVPPPPPERPKIWHARRRGYIIFYFCYDHVTWYTYKLCCPVCNDLPL